MVCASAAEVNCLTDLEIMVNLNQIELVSMLYSQFKSLVSSDDIDEVDVFETPKQTMPGHSKHNFPIKQVLPESEVDYTRDSGVDFETSSANSTNLVSFKNLSFRGKKTFL